MSRSGETTEEPRERKLIVKEVNRFSQEEFVERFGQLFEHSPWVAERAWNERPFESMDGLRDAFEKSLRDASREERIGLIRAHPDLAGKAAVAGELTEASGREQSSAGLDRLSPEEFEDFIRANREYRERFDMPLIVCVRDHTKESILKAAEARLGNTREEEIENALMEISRIARYRLMEIVEEGDTG